MVESKNVEHQIFAKVQKIDFMGSINQTKEERDNNQARLFAELYRSFKVKVGNINR